MDHKLKTPNCDSIEKRYPSQHWTNMLIPHAPLQVHGTYENEIGPG
jgi:hypothetical protein